MDLPLVVLVSSVFIVSYLIGNLKVLSFVFIALSTNFFGFLTTPVLDLYFFRLSVGDVLLANLIFVSLWKLFKTGIDLRVIDRSYYFLIGIVFTLGIIHSYRGSSGIAEAIIYNRRLITFGLSLLCLSEVYSKDSRLYKRLFLQILYVSYFLYLFQYFGFNLYGTPDELLAQNRIVRSYPLMYFLPIYFIAKRKYVLFLLTASTIFALSKTVSILLAFVFVALFMVKNVGKILKLVVFLIGLLFLVNSIDVFQVYELVFQDTFNKDDLISYYHDGSLKFRFALLYERYVYWRENIFRVFFGVGFLSESVISESIFTLGTANDFSPSGIEQFDSADILYPTLMLRYGILGTLSFAIFYFRHFLRSSKNKLSLNSRLGLAVLVFLAVTSIASNQMMFYDRLAVLILFIGKE